MYTFKAYTVNEQTNYDRAEGYVNGVQVFDYAGNSGRISSAFRYLIGAYNDATDTGETMYQVGYIQEHVIFRSDTAPSRGDVDTNINEFYSIY